MVTIPLSQQPAQSFSVQLGGKNCDITLQQKSTGLFMDLTLNGVQIVASGLCLDRVGIVRYSYLGFVGQLAFIDTQGTNDPVYTDFGTRYVLAYLS